jgi:hypothetical protein
LRLFCWCRIVISAASPLALDAFAAAEAGADYFSTEGHYLSLAGRIAAALRDGGSFVLVTGDPPAAPHALSQALRKATEPRYAVIDVVCGPDLTPDELSRAGSVVATLSTSGGATAISETSEPFPLFVFNDTDRLSEQQIREIFEVIQHGARKSSAGVLLAHSGFLERLREPSLQFLRDGLAAQFEFQEVGQDEGIEFLRHQLATRHRRSESSGVPSGVFRGLAASGLLLTVGVCAFLFLQYIGLDDEPSALSVIGTSSSREASTQTRSEIPAKPEPPTISPAAPPIAAAPSPVPMPPAAAPAAAYPPAPDPVAPRETLPVITPDRPSRAAEGAHAAALPAPAREQTTLQATSRAALPPPTQPSAGQRLSPAEIAALVNRGDGFLSAGDIASARLFYERAADEGDAAAALRLGATFDPAFLGRAGVRGDPALASSWYRRARDLGDPVAEKWLKDLEQQRVAEPNSPAH